MAFFRDRTALPDLGAMIPRPIGKINCRSNAAACRDLPAARMATPTRLDRDAPRLSCYKHAERRGKLVRRMSVLLEKRSNGVAVVTLNRPQVLNALDVPAKERLGSIWQEIADDPEVRVPSSPARVKRPSAPARTSRRSTAPGGWSPPNPVARHSRRGCSAGQTGHRGAARLLHRHGHDPGAALRPSARRQGTPCWAIPRCGTA